MISILFTMIRARRTQALTMLLLSAVATIAAIAGPAYLHHVDATVAERQLADASAAQRTIEFKVAISPGSALYGNQTDPQVTSTLASMPGFTAIQSTDMPITVVSAPLPVTAPGTVPAKPPIERLVSRQDSCVHVTMIEGRCMIGVGEVVLSQKVATQLHVRPGGIVSYTTSVPSVGMNANLTVPSGVFHATVTGIYVPISATEAYWGPTPYFAAGTTPPILTDEPTLDALPSSVEVVTTLAVPNSSMFESDLSQLSAAVSTSAAKAAAAHATFTSQIPALIVTIRSNEAVASRLIPIAAAPLVALAWFVIFLAAAYTAGALRFEYGVVALRGSPRGLRWWLAMAENVTMILIGSLLSYIVVRLFGPASLTWALVALAGSVVAALAAVVKQVSSSAAPLLRRIPAAVRGMGSRIGLICEVLIVIAAIATGIQLRISGGDLQGVTLLVPGLIILATATAASFAVIPLARRIGHRAVQRGRVATALAAFGIGRRPGAQRVLILMAVSVGLLAFAAAGLSVASTGRADLSVVQTGAARVVSVAPSTRDQLLGAVDAADPDGQWAMAVVSLPSGTPGIPPVLAVDATRLGAVATWGPAYGPLSAAQVGALLHPSGYPPPITVTGAAIAVDVTATRMSELTEMTLSVNLVPLDGSAPASVELGSLANGARTLTGSVPCAGGCVLDGFRVDQNRLGGYQFGLQIRGVRVDGTQLIDGTAGKTWSASNGATIAAAAGGATIAFDSAESTATNVRLAAVPSPLPIVTTTRLPKSVSISLLDATSIPVVDVAVLPGLPRLGRSGGLIDLGYAETLADDNDASVNPQVWLGPKAPADALSRLASHGLIVASSTTPAAEATDLNEQGPAEALRFHLLAALLAVLLAVGTILLVAVVDRQPRTDELAALRVQGLSARTVGRAASAGYTSIAALGSLIGLASAALAWWAAGGYLPIFTAAQSIWPAPSWPDPVAVAWPWLASLVLLCVVAFLAGIDLRRSIRSR